MDQAWRLSALYGYGGGNDYNDEPWKDTDAVLPPDPIDVAGQVRVPALRKRCNALGFRALSEAFDLVTAENNAELRRWWNGYGEKRGREEGYPGVFATPHGLTTVPLGESRLLEAFARSR